MLTAFYDLQVSPPTWDATKFILIAAMSRQIGEPMRLIIVPGPNDGFRHDNLPPDLPMRRRMLEHVVVRYCDLFPNITVEVCTSREEAIEAWRPVKHEKIFPASYTPYNPVSHYGEDCLIAAHKLGLPLPVTTTPPAQAVQADTIIAGRSPVLILLREAVYWPLRNSLPTEWSTFGHWLQDHRDKDVVVVRDTSKSGEQFEDFETVDVQDICLLHGLMERSEIVYGVCNGPMALAWWGTRIPYRTFKFQVPGYGSSAWYASMGIPVGSNYPWATRDQCKVWCDDTADVLCASFDDHITKAGESWPLKLTA